ncbi:MAG TPA: hypothetical protein VMB03_06670 [Bryobacteraceae bacterium]|nr:hypothetical protein [Bryobacteraceae bacterium]
MTPEQFRAIAAAVTELRPSATGTPGLSAAERLTEYSRRFARFDRPVRGILAFSDVDRKKKSAQPRAAQRRTPSPAPGIGARDRGVNAPKQARLVRLTSSMRQIWSFESVGNIDTAGNRLACAKGILLSLNRTRNFPAAVVKMAPRGSL